MENKRKEFKIFSLFVFTFMFSSCVKEAEFKYGENIFPTCETKAVTDINEDGATFHSRINNITNYKFDYVLFIWECDDTPGGPFRFSDTANIKNYENVEKRIKYNLSEGFTYKVTSYVFAGDYTIIGDSRSFVSKGSRPNPYVGYLTPFSGFAGTKVHLYGMNFGSDPSELKVTIRGYECPIDTLSSSYARIIIPDMPGPFNDEVILERNGLTSKYNRHFIYRYVPGY